MIKLKAVESKGDYRLLLRFLDRTAGVYDFAPFVEATTEMTAPLADPAFLRGISLRLGRWLGRTGLI